MRFGIGGGFFYSLTLWASVYVAACRPFFRDYFPLIWSRCSHTLWANVYVTA